MARKVSFGLLLGCLLAAWACDCASGQTTGRISGVIRDPSGSVVAKADVRAINQATNEAWSTTTGQAGEYSFLLLPPGLYRIEVAPRGFKTAVLTGVSVRVTETTTADASVAVGTRVETVVVRGSAPIVQADGPQLEREVSHCLRVDYGSLLAISHRF
jgi:hypothetical protein